MAVYNPNLHIKVTDAPYSAVGDGVTDDSVAIDAAQVAAQAAGKDLYFPAGTYIYTSVATALAFVRLFGSSPSTTILKGPFPATPAVQLQILGAADITINGCSIGPPYSYLTALDERVFLNTTFIMDDNLVSYPSAFDNAYWTKTNSTITPNAVLAPDGTLTADKIIADAAGGLVAGVSASTAINVSTQSYTWSYQVKYAGERYVQIWCGGTAASSYANFDLVSGTVTAGTGTISQLNDGWFLVSLVVNCVAGTLFPFIAIIDSGSSGRASTHTGNGINGVYACVYKIKTTTSTLTYYFYDGVPSYQGETIINNCTFDICDCYTTLGLYNPSYATITNNTFTARGVASHVIRLWFDSTNNKGANISNNKILGGGTTGIFVGSNRVFPIENIDIEGNEIHNISEEAISFDGFGNNAGLCPVICNGTLSSVSNDSNGRLVIGMGNMKYHNGTTAAQPSPVSLRTDWRNFYFVFSDSTNIDGTIAEIYSYDSVANTLTLNIHTLAASVALTGFAGVHAGFFNCVIRNNRIYGYNTSTGVAAAGISVYLNVFNNTVEGNVISGFLQGISLYGGFMLGTYHTLAYYNTIKNNTVVQCLPAGSGGNSVMLYSLFGGLNQIGNKVTDNDIVGGQITIQNQRRLTYRDNNTPDVTTVFTSNAVSYP